jgi:hypothetical protein
MQLMQQERGIQSPVDTSGISREPFGYGVDMVVRNQERVAYYSLSSENEDYVGGFEIARFGEYPNDRAIVRVRWSTPPGINLQLEHAKTYVTKVRSAAVDSRSIPDEHDLEGPPTVLVYVAEDTLFSKSASGHFAEFPTTEDIEVLYESAYNNGAQKLGLVKLAWHDAGMVGGEIWFTPDRIKVLTQEKLIRVYDNRAALVEFFKSSALYPNYAQDFSESIAQSLYHWRNK